ncbi:hypothetical protein CCHR01_19135 [Colletotrichum chrysophilum]|uniref:Uncharacterized protein n=1 Tax=Colletotrichum chrysophilum TaxID=1836956 RepID=A0AAD8ZZH1_9PEZI|nr:hypothetical protein CCHR01_19135 [Colletotrichum chrysophilum]
MFLSLSHLPPSSSLHPLDSQTKRPSFPLNCKMHPFTESQRASSRLPCAEKRCLGFRSLNSQFLLITPSKQQPVNAMRLPNVEYVRDGTSNRVSLLFILLFLNSLSLRTVTPTTVIQRLKIQAPFAIFPISRPLLSAFNFDKVRSRYWRWMHQ